MKESGQIVLFKFPQTDQSDAKLRPTLLIGKLPGLFNDWFICMISTQLRHYVEGFDQIIQDGPTHNSPHTGLNFLRNGSDDYG